MVRAFFQLALAMFSVTLCIDFFAFGRKKPSYLLCRHCYSVMKPMELNYVNITSKTTEAARRTEDFVPHFILPVNQFNLDLPT
jgi:hypothetical protein